MENTICRVYSSISDIDKRDWDVIFGDIPEGYEFYKTLEDSKLKEFSFYYAVLYRDKQAILIAPLFITDFDLDIAVEGWFKKIISNIRKVIPRFLTLKTLFCGSPFGEYGVVGLSSDVGNEHETVKGLLNGLDEFSRQERIKFVVFKDFPESQAKVLDALLGEGFFKVKSFPAALNELDFNSLEEYIKSLGHSTRKNLRRKMKSAYSQAKITVKVVDRIDSIIEEVYRLYFNTHCQGATKFERLTKEFFINAGRNMQPNVKFFLYYVNDRLGAFNLCFVYKDLCIDKFIGFDYDISNLYHLYFVSWCYNIEWCLKNSIRLYKTGQTDYYAKIRLGGKLVPLYAYLRHRNKAANAFFKILSLVLKPDNFDTDIQNN